MCVGVGVRGVGCVGGDVGDVGGGVDLDVQYGEVHQRMYNETTQHGELKRTCGHDHYNSKDRAFSKPMLLRLVLHLQLNPFDDVDDDAFATSDDDDASANSTFCQCLLKHD
jgi:hypothetical protein